MSDGGVLTPAVEMCSRGQEKGEGKSLALCSGHSRVPMHPRSQRGAPRRRKSAAKPNQPKVTHASLNSSLPPLLVRPPAHSTLKERQRLLPTKPLLLSCRHRRLFPRSPLITPRKQTADIKTTSKISACRYRRKNAEGMVTFWWACPPRGFALPKGGRSLLVFWLSAHAHGGGRGSREGEVHRRG